MYTRFQLASGYYLPSLMPLKGKASTSHYCLRSSLYGGEKFCLFILCAAITQR